MAQTDHSASSLKDRVEKQQVHTAKAMFSQYIVTFSEDNLRKTQGPGAHRPFSARADSSTTSLTERRWERRRGGSRKEVEHDITTV